MAEATALAASTDGDDPDAFPRMRARVFADLGLHLPDVDVVLDDDVPQGCCAVRLHHVSCRPERLPAGPGAAALADVLESRVREHAWWFVDVEHVRATVDTMRLALPALVETVTSRYTVVELSVFARALLAEAVPLRNAARLMVLLLDVPAAPRDADVVRLAEPRRGDHGSSGSRPTADEVVAHARQQVLEEWTRAEPGPRDVVVHRLPDSDLEVPQLLQHAAAAASAGVDLVVSTQARRAAVRAALAGQYPDVLVRASEEFPVSVRLVASEDGQAPVMRG
jgi:flagellar biosynthesis component FlhA